MLATFGIGPTHAEAKGDAGTVAVSLCAGLARVAPNQDVWEVDACQCEVLLLADLLEGREQPALEE